MIALHNKKKTQGDKTCKGRQAVRTAKEGKPRKVEELKCDLRFARLSCKLHQVKAF